MIKLIQVAVCKCIINWSKPEFSGRNENMRQQESWEVEDKRKPETERPQLILDSCQTKYISLSMMVETIIIAHLLYLPRFVKFLWGFWFENSPWLNTVFHILKNLNRSWIDRHFVFGL
jgi:hypothetical protein